MGKKPLVALTNHHGPDGVEPRFVEAGQPIPESWRIPVGAAGDYVEQLVVSGGAGSWEDFKKTDLARSHKTLIDDPAHRGECVDCGAAHGRNCALCNLLDPPHPVTVG